ncbi:MAG: ArsR family transcriptional regulator [Pseudomonas sp.]|uniref:helix-turn-helix transcriptional regulator n=1 Tax=Pseudomonas sp. TaxID=306 RepID=UPI003C7509F1
MSTKSDLLHLLQREPLTVVQLCEHLAVTRNAVIVQLKQLESEGLVRRSKIRPPNTVGKPPVVFEAAPGSEDVTSTAYQVLLTQLLATLKDRYDVDELGDVLEQTGRQLAQRAGLANPTTFDSGLRAAMAAADALGASTEAVQQDGGVMVRNFTCPVGSVVREEQCVCRAMAAFFSEATGMPASEQCLREDRLICQYFIELSERPAE